MKFDIRQPISLLKEHFAIFHYRDGATRRSRPVVMIKQIINLLRI